VPLLVGGKESTMIGNIIVDQVSKTRNWPLASAFSMLLTILSLIGVFWMLTTERGNRFPVEEVVTSQTELEDSVAEHHKTHQGGAS
jgi:spermidine/putrescine transport system permease protein